MSEEQKNAAVNPEAATSGSPVGNKPEAAPADKSGDGDVERMEKENERLEKAIAKREELNARIRRGGSAMAGTPMKTQADLDKEKITADVKKSMARFGI